MRIKETAEGLAPLQMILEESRWPVRWLALVVALVASLVAWGALRFLSPPARLDCDAAARVMVVLGSGGHTAEMLRLVGSMRESRVQAATFLVAASDGHSEAKVASLARERGWRGWRVVRVPRSREVGQSYATSVLTTLWALLWCLGVVARERPHVVLLNGPGTCLPVAFWARVLGTLPGVPSPHVLFVESIARVRELSLTGRLLLRLRLATRVFGQWDEIVEREGVEAIPRLY